ncbi:MAG: thioesterase family protein, partial [Proteobacteria bacterium]|nr:thioesterase family protein [Pseudomonadota bacterium]
RYMHNGSAQLGAQIWFRATARLPDRREEHETMLAYASDLTLLDAALVAHGTSVFDPGVLPASLDHAMWFHRPFRADEWLLYSQDSPNAGGGRGFARGLIYSREGLLVASVAQEGIIRKKRSS